MLGPSRLRAGQKIPSSSRVSSTRWTLLLMEVYDNLDFWPYNGEIKKVIWPVGVGGLFHHNSKTFKWKVLSWSIRKDFATPPLSITSHPGTNKLIHCRVQMLLTAIQRSLDHISAQSRVHRAKLLHVSIYQCSVVCIAAGLLCSCWAVLLVQIFPISLPPTQRYLPGIINVHHHRSRI